MKHTSATALLDISTTFWEKQVKRIWASLSANSEWRCQLRARVNQADPMRIFQDLEKFTERLSLQISLNFNSSEKKPSYQADDAHAFFFKLNLLSIENSLKAVFYQNK